MCQQFINNPTCCKHIFRDPFEYDITYEHLQSLSERKRLSNPSQVFKAL